MDYGRTLNLPRTPFPMKADLSKSEPEILEFWKENRIYNKIKVRLKGKPLFVLHDGPPYSNGGILPVHAVNKILKDAVIKSKILSGSNVSFIPGWDNHGLPNEIEAATALSLDPLKAESLEFRRKCREFAAKFVEIQKEQFIRLGVFAEWDNPYLTMDKSYEAGIVRVFSELARKNFIYRSLKPVNWCPHCMTAVDEAEMVYQEKESPSVFAKFPLKGDISKIFNGNLEGVCILIWTTSPWTLTGNLAVALNAEAGYTVLHAGNENLIVAESLADSVAEVIGFKNYEKLGSFKGLKLHEFDCINPVTGKDSIVVAENFVAVDQKYGGTGCVHIAPGMGYEDFEVGIKYNLPIMVTVDASGRMDKNSSEYNGLSYPEADIKVAENLRSKGLLIHEDKVSARVPHCWRCNNPLICRAEEQWFLAMDVRNLRIKALEASERIKWHPEWGKNRVTKMIAERDDWCISRQRFWGTPIPVFYCNDCSYHLLDETVFKAVENLFRKEGADIWFEKPAEEILPAGTSCPACGSKSFRKEKDIFDVWFESALTCELLSFDRTDFKFPADMYLESHEQYRGWFQHSIITSSALKGMAPFKIALSHGLAVDGENAATGRRTEEEERVSKFIKAYGAEILRFCILSAERTGEIKFTDGAMREALAVYNKIRNVCRFMLGNLYDYNPAEDSLKAEDLEALDRWILQATSEMIKKVLQNMENCNLHTAFHMIYNFFAIELSGLYLEIVKDRLYLPAPGSRARKSAQKSLYEIMRNMAIIISPFISFTSEEIWQSLPAKDSESVFLADLKTPEKKYLKDFEEEAMEIILGLRSSVYRVIESLRARGMVHQSYDAEIGLYLNDKLYELLKEYSELMREFFIVSKVNLFPPEALKPQDVFMIEDYDGLGITAKPAEGKRCARCRHIKSGISDEGGFSGLCPDCRECVEVIA
ncbi:MAG: isoleucine--tRNA ligase [Firmicutes bacterium]|nr:isoleucine--tRNA ligase [Bacillota bacterium]